MDLASVLRVMEFRLPVPESFVQSGGRRFTWILALSLVKCFNMYFSKGGQLCSVITGRRKIALHLHGYKNRMDRLKVGWPPHYRWSRSGS